ncbi:MAG: hypothetical protein KKH04_18340 [Proteobacteria bacterium]|nr:hypothetical protein [Pseudomonadota bacterium]
MYFDVLCHVFLKPPEHLMLRDIWNIGPGELSDEGSRALEIIDSGKLKDIDLRNVAVWTSFAIQEFQDLQAMPLPKSGKFFNVNYMFFESLSALRESILTGLNGQLHASFAVLRSSCELLTFHYWWKDHLQFADSYDPFYDWLFGSQKGPRFSKVIDDTFRKIDLPPLCTNKETFLSVYGKLCSYAHKPLITEAITTMRGGNIPVVSHELLYFWLDLLERAQRAMLDLAICRSPQALFPVDLNRKFGFNPPIGVLFDKYSFISVERALGPEALNSYRAHFQCRTPPRDILDWYESQPDITAEQILASWSDETPLGNEDLPFDERVSGGNALLKAKVRASQRAFAYMHDSPSIEGPAASSLGQR